MMKPDIDTEKYSGHNIHNNMFIKTFSDPENMKILLKMALPGAIVQAIDFPEMNIDFTTYVSDYINKNSVSSVTSVAKINFMAGRNAIRRKNGVMGHYVVKKKFHFILFHHQIKHFHP